MTADTSVYQFAYLKQPTDNYLLQLDEITYKLQGLIEALKLLSSFIQEGLKSAYTIIDEELIPIIDLINLNIVHTEGTELLQEAANEIESYKGFEYYSNALAKVKLEVKQFNALTQQLQELKTETYELLSGSTPHIKASKLEIKALYERYAKALDLLKQTALKLQSCKSFLNKRYQTSSELLDENSTD